MNFPFYDENYLKAFEKFQKEVSNIKIDFEEDTGEFTIKMKAEKDSEYYELLKSLFYAMKADEYLEKITKDNKIDGLNFDYSFFDEFHNFANQNNFDDELENMIEDTQLNLNTVKSFIGEYYNLEDIHICKIPDGLTYFDGPPLFQYLSIVISKAFKDSKISRFPLSQKLNTVIRDFSKNCKVINGTIDKFMISVSDSFNFSIIVESTISEEKKYLILYGGD